MIKPRDITEVLNGLIRHIISAILEYDNFNIFDMQYSCNDYSECN